MDPRLGRICFEPYFTTEIAARAAGSARDRVRRGETERRFRVGHSEPAGHEREDQLAVAAFPQSGARAAAAVPIVSLRGTETILLVEDEDAVRAVARQVLQRTATP